MNNLQKSMAVIILIASITGIVIASVNFFNKLVESERIQAELFKAKQEHDQAVKDYNDYIGGDRLP